MFGDIDRAAFDGLRRRILAKKVIVVPVVAGPDRARDKTAATVGADIVEHLLDTFRAKRAFETADHGLGGIRRQGFVAVLAGGSEFQHMSFVTSF